MSLLKKEKGATNHICPTGHPNFIVVLTFLYLDCKSFSEELVGRCFAGKTQEPEQLALNSRGVLSRSAGQMCQSY